VASLNLHTSLLGTRVPLQVLGAAVRSALEPLLLKGRAESPWVDANNMLQLPVPSQGAYVLYERTVRVVSQQTGMKVFSTRRLCWLI
jgi:hypothetical protein